MGANGTEARCGNEPAGRGGGPPGGSAFARIRNGARRTPEAPDESPRPVAFEPLEFDVPPASTGGVTDSPTPPPASTSASASSSAFPGGRAHLPLLSRRDGGPQVAFVGTAFTRATATEETAAAPRSTFTEYFSTESLFNPGDPIASPLGLDRGSDPCRVLGLPADATWREVVRAHRRLVKENHPDRLGDVEPAIRAAAEARFREINEAYREIERSLRNDDAD